MNKLSDKHHNRPPKQVRPLFPDLLATSHAIKRALSPVNARPSFVTKLREELNSNVEATRYAFIQKQRQRDKIRWTALGAGIAVYSVGITVVIIRIVRWWIDRIRK
ncbi:MAG: hypothetical protein MK000_08610 [Anaerolineales bacterium]|nr:hypothetical protein [Anaerolineales bacterium]